MGGGRWCKRQEGGNRGQLGAREDFLQRTVIKRATAPLQMPVPPPSLSLSLSFPRTLPAPSRNTFFSLSRENFIKIMHPALPLSIADSRLVLHTSLGIWGGGGRKNSGRGKFIINPM